MPGTHVWHVRHRLACHTTLAYHPGLLLGLRPVVPLKGARVLVVDDAADYAAILAEVLRPHGIEVVVGGSVEQALVLLQNERIDLVVTDLNLPGASGIDLIREVRRRDELLPIILVTGSGSVHHAVEALKEGANDYLQKPLDPIRLIALARGLLNSDGVKETAEGGDGAGVAFEGMLGASPVMQTSSIASARSRRHRLRF